MDNIPVSLPIQIIFSESFEATRTIYFILFIYFLKMSNTVFHIQHWNEIESKCQYFSHSLCSLYLVSFHGFWVTQMTPRSFLSEYCYLIYVHNIWGNQNLNESRAEIEIRGRNKWSYNKWAEKINKRSANKTQAFLLFIPSGIKINWLWGDMHQNFHLV